MIQRLFDDIPFAISRLLISEDRAETVSSLIGLKELASLDGLDRFILHRSVTVLFQVFREPLESGFPIPFPFKAPKLFFRVRFLRLLSYGLADGRAEPVQTGIRISEIMRFLSFFFVGKESFQCVQYACHCTGVIDITGRFYHISGKNTKKPTGSVGCIVSQVIFTYLA